MANKYEYECDVLPLTPDQLQAASMGLLTADHMEHLNQLILDKLNERGSQGWRVITPVSLPTIFFEREKPARRPAAKKKTTTKKGS